MSERVIGDTRALLRRIRYDLSPVYITKPNPSALEKTAVDEWNSQIFVPSQGRTWPDMVWENLTAYMLFNLTSEMRQLVTQLRVSSPSLFDQYDRARGEAEFRLSVSFPLIFVAGVLAWKWAPLWLLLLLGVVLIMQSGMRRAREATDVVAQAALIGYVTPTGWVNRDDKPLTIAHQALDTAMRKPVMDFYDAGISHDDLEKMEVVLRLLPKPPPEKATGTFPTASP